MKVVIFINTLTVHIAGSNTTANSKSTLCGIWGYPRKQTPPFEYLKIKAGKELPFCKTCEKKFLEGRT